MQAIAAHSRKPLCWKFSTSLYGFSVLHIAVGEGNGPCVFMAVYCLFAYRGEGEWQACHFCIEIVSNFYSLLLYPQVIIVAAAHTHTHTHTRTHRSLQYMLTSNTDCVEAFCHHKDTLLTGQKTYKNSCGREMVCCGKWLCAMNADVPFK